MPVTSYRSQTDTNGSSLVFQAKVLQRDHPILLFSDTDGGIRLSELEEIQCPQTPLDGSRLWWSTWLSQNPSYRIDLLAYDVYVLVKPCIYMLVAAVIQTCRLELLQVPREISPSPSYTSLKEALDSILN
jgi:hypothetical protein